MQIKALSLNPQIYQRCTCKLYISLFPVIFELPDNNFCYYLLLGWPSSQISSFWSQNSCLFLYVLMKVRLLNRNSHGEIAQTMTSCLTSFGMNLTLPRGSSQYFLNFLCCFKIHHSLCLNIIGIHSSCAFFFTDTALPLSWYFQLNAFSVFHVFILIAPGVVICILPLIMVLTSPFMPINIVPLPPSLKSKSNFYQPSVKRVCTQIIKNSDSLINTPIFKSSPSPILLAILSRYSQKKFNWHWSSLL